MQSAAMDWDFFFYNSSAFAAALFLLQFGADRLIDNTAIVARRLGVSQTLIALLTAGAEWEELAVVVASIAQNRSDVALGNVLGSSIANILGAFSLALLFQPGHLEFDSVAQTYAITPFALTTVFTALALSGLLNRATGGILIAFFALYLFSIAYVMYRGVLDAPDEPDDLDEDEVDDDEDQTLPVLVDTERLPLIESTQPDRPQKNKKRALFYHIIQIVLGFLALSLSGYVLSHSASSLANSLNLSGTIVGVTILAFATTLPEKFVTIMSGAKGHGGIVVANTAGSNIFLLTLCLGVTLLAGNREDLAKALQPFEVLATWTASAIFFLIVFLGSTRLVGVLLLALYIVFLVLEFTVFRR